jgi:methylase of polypeptide subunit release factors
MRIEGALGVCSVREDTELLAEVAAAAVPPGRALDLGTGSGYVAVYLAARGFLVDAVDVSPRALALARRNAELNGALLEVEGGERRGRVEVYRSDLFEAVRGSFDLIASNPPMRGDETEASRLVTSALRRVPPVANALAAALHPLLERRRIDFLARIARGAAERLAPGGRVVLAITEGEAVRLAAMVPALELVDHRPVGSIPWLGISTFRPAASCSIARGAV